MNKPKRRRQATHGQGEEIMAFRARARRPATRPARSGRATRKRNAIKEASQ